MNRRDLIRRVFGTMAGAAVAAMVSERADARAVTEWFGPERHAMHSSACEQWVDETVRQLPNRLPPTIINLPMDEGTFALLPRHTHPLPPLLSELP